MTDKQRPFGVSMTEREFAECLPADEAAFRSPIPGAWFLAGAFLSLLAGFVGMKGATYANTRTAQAAAGGSKADARASARTRELRA